MPDPMEDPEAAAQWMLSKVCTNLGDAKLWPVRLATVKYSDALGPMACMIWTLMGKMCMSETWTATVHHATFAPCCRTFYGWACIRAGAQLSTAAEVRDTGFTDSTCMA